MTKAMSKAERRRRAKALGEARRAEEATAETDSAVRIGIAPDSAPTTEARTHGAYKRPQKDGAGNWFNAAQDMIGKLYDQRKLTYQQHEAARTFQEMRAAYVAELGVSGYRSCLDGSQGGYDAGDGNPAVMRAYDDMRDRIGRVSTARLVLECDRGADCQPYDLDGLRNALDVMNEG